MVQLTQEDLQRIVVLEGPPFSGKTTLLNYLAEKYIDEFVVIKETSEYIGGDQNGPKVPYKTYVDAKAGTHFLLEVERRRWLDIIEALTKTNKIVVVDRYLPLSSSAFFVAIENIFADWHQFNTSLFDYSLSLYDSAKNAEIIADPSLFIFLYPENRSVFESRLPRGAQNGFFMKWENCEIVIDYYSKVFSKELLASRTLLLASNNNPEFLEEAVLKIRLFLKVLRKSTQIDLVTLLRKDNKLNIDYESEVIEYAGDIMKAKVIMEKVNTI
jgi:hypothetical protein